MKKILFLLIFSTFISSCSTIFNHPYKYVTIHTTKPSVIIHQKDTLQTKDNKVHLKVKRKKEVLVITAKTDSLTKTFEIKPRLSPMFWWNINYYGVGMLVDLTNRKRFTYPQRIYINFEDTISNYKRFGKVNNKGELNLSLSMPLINGFRFKLQNEKIKESVGMLGFTLGLDYYHSKNRFISVVGSATTNLVVIFRNPESMSSIYAGVLDNHKFRRFSVGYGLSYSQNIFEVIKYTFFFATTTVSVERNIALGFIFPTYFQVTNSFHVGLVYKPSFYRPTMPEKFAYEHTIHFDFAWKIRLKK